MKTNNLKEVLNNFLNANRKKWAPVKKNRGKVLIDGLQDIPSYISIASVISRVINSTKGYEPLPIISAKKLEQSTEYKLFSSFGITQFINLRDSKYNVYRILKSCMSCVIFYIQVKDKKSLLDYYNKDIKIGDLIYDSYIRYDHRYRKFSIYSFSFVKLLLYSFYLFHTYKIIFKTYEIKYIILSHRVYINCGLLARMGFIYGKKVIISRKTNIRVYQNKNNDNIFNNEFKPTNEIVKEIKGKKLYNKMEEYLNKRFRGQIEQHDVLNAYKNKKIYSKKDLIRSFSLNPSLPIVFIMPHVFSDAPHGNKKLLFLDYYEWFIETIKIANEISNVNWFVKPHPSSHMYGERGDVANILKNLKLDNLILTPEDINTLTVVQTADTIVTVNGSIGLEMACMGIKPIITGDSMYSGYDIAYEPKNKTEYYNLLRNIKEKTELSPELIKIARSILYWIKTGSFSDSKIFDIPTIYTSRDPNDLIKQKIQQYKILLNNINKFDYSNDPFFINTKYLIENNESFIKRYR